MPFQDPTQKAQQVNKVMEILSDPDFHYRRDTAEAIVAALTPAPRTPETVEQSTEWDVEVTLADGTVIPMTRSTGLTEDFARYRIESHKKLPTTVRLMKRTKTIIYTDWVEAE